MKVCASRPSSFVSERNKPHNGAAFLSALEYLNPTRAKVSTFPSMSPSGCALPAVPQTVARKSLQTR